MSFRRHRKGYKFTEKTHSVRGMISFAMGVASLVVFFAVISNSFNKDGEGSLYLGAAGVSCMILSIFALILSSQSHKEENSFKLFPNLSTLCSVVAFVLWTALYILGLR